MGLHLFGELGSRKRRPRLWEWCKLCLKSRRAKGKCRRVLGSGHLCSCLPTGSGGRISLRICCSSGSDASEAGGKLNSLDRFLSIWDGCIGTIYRVLIGCVVFRILRSQGLGWVGWLLGLWWKMRRMSIGMRWLCCLYGDYKESRTRLGGRSRLLGGRWGCWKADNSFCMVLVGGGNRRFLRHWVLWASLWSRCCLLLWLCPMDFCLSCLWCPFWLLLIIISYQPLNFQK